MLTSWQMPSNSVVDSFVVTERLHDVVKGTPKQYWFRI